MSDEETKGTKELLSKIDRTIEDIRNKHTADSLRIELLEERFRNSFGSGFVTGSQFGQQEAPFAGNPGQFQQPQQTTGAFSPERLSSLATEDIQGEFQALKDSHQRVKLSSDFKLNENKTGIARSDQSSYNIIVKSGRYVETGLKILSQIDIERLPPDIKELLGDLFVCESAHIRYLQEEYASLLVQGQYGRDTSRLFRSLQRNTSAFNPQSLEQLRNAVTITAAARPTQRGGFGRGRGGFGRGSNRQDIFQQFQNRSVPTRRPSGPSTNNSPDNMSAEQ